MVCRREFYWPESVDDMLSFASSVNVINICEYYVKNSSMKWVVFYKV